MISKTVYAPCPGCQTDIYIDHYPKLGEFVTCPECGDLVEVVSLSPLILDWSPDLDDEDWDEYWDDDEDFDDEDDFDE